MDKEALKIPKKLKPVKAWVHPDGLVLGSLFVHLQSARYLGEESPAEILNGPEPFFVIQCGEDETRFYNKHSVVRLEHAVDAPGSEDNAVCLGARLHLMDGSNLVGTIRELLDPQNARLYDYINIHDQRFVRLFLSDTEVTLVNKAYIVRVSPDDDAPRD
ncbi:MULTISPECIES: hypothetical protein [Ectothiorhodospira]|uniref:Uncharacterized protein n=1 Tax=Ectothiorhodospira marina TaxID=1396821 RepID=A0A1H7H0T1_9GAMM|nr:hypothetical protein [Ectothiorhodospira marina]MCG5515651.1 hypothetical protein [Ectothiorhodospira sp. 9100]MCG5518825.1 hypothetical protein [Ectothiorhodospira sp. 9905]SEK44026.1 hypothetical protein SAMN05444515_10235 [Ectothiorhodospira marina]